MLSTPPRDRYDLPLTTSSRTAAEAYVDAIDRVLSGNLGAPEGFGRAIADDEGFALAHAALALTCLLRGKLDEAKPHVARARAAASGVSRRERQHVEAIATAVDEGPPRAHPLLREHLTEFPRDALMLTLLVGTQQATGRQDWPAQAFGLVETFAPHYGEDWWFLGLHSFANHELRRFEESRQLGERSLSLNPRNANPTHSLAHVFYETNDHAGGVAFLDDWIGGYEQQAPFHGHLTWHLALFELALGHYQRAIAVYEQGLQPNVVVESRLALPDAASFLWRWYIYGAAGQALPWTPVRDLASRLAARPGMAFLDAHAALAFAGAGDDLAMDRLIDGLRDLHAGGHPLAGTVVLPLAQGIGAFAQGNYEETIRLIEPVADQVIRIGGSHAQREVFEDTLIQAYLRAGRFEQATTLLRRRLEHRHSARDFAWLGQAQTGSGQSELAGASLRAAGQLWPDADLTAPEVTWLRDHHAEGRGPVDRQ